MIFSSPCMQRAQVRNAKMIRFRRPPNLMKKENKHALEGWCRPFKDFERYIYIVSTQLALNGQPKRHFQRNR